MNVTASKECSLSVISQISAKCAAGTLAHWHPPVSKQKKQRRLRMYLSS